MGKWWFIANAAIILILVTGMFYYIPNGVLLGIATLPYTIWWLTFKEKTHYVAIPIVFLFFISIFFLLPYLHFAGMAEDVVFFYQMYDLIFPSGFSYSWSQFMPTQFWGTLGIMLALILWVKIAFWLIRRIYRKISNTNFMLALSRLLMYVLFIYVLIGVITVLLFIDIFEAFRSFIAVSLVYDVLFVWLPFIVLYFLIEWFLNVVIHGKKY